MSRAALAAAVSIAVLLVLAVGLQHAASYPVADRGASLLLGALGFTVALGAVFALVRHRGRTSG